MLYVTTRNDRETFTVHRVLTNSRGPDGGLFVPLHMPVFSKEEIESLLNATFESCIAQILNRLFSAKLTPWDISCQIGRHPVRIQNIGYRTVIAECWHNPKWTFQQMVESISMLINPGGTSTQWVNVAVRSAVFAGICGQCRKMGITQPMDIAVVSGDFCGPISAWYARCWGFPIGNIVCCCNENGNLWELFANGQMHTDGIAVSTCTLDADIILPEALEQLIYACGGSAEVERYVDVCRQGEIYYPADAVLSKMCKGMYVSVVSQHRILETIPRVYASKKYLLSPYDALCYCGLSDYRSRFSETGQGLLFSDRSPICEEATVTDALGISAEDFGKIYN